MKTKFKSTIDKILHVANESESEQTSDKVSRSFAYEEEKDYIQALIKEEELLACESVLTSLPEDKTVIASGVKIRGDITVEGNMDILGTVDGDITSFGDVHVTGTVHGNLTADQITMSNGIVFGRTITATDSIFIHHSTIKADINGNHIEVNGEVVGNLKATQLVSIKCDSKLIGNITAGSISIQEGAQIDGFFKTTL